MPIPSIQPPGPGQAGPLVIVTDYDRTFTRPDLSLAEETLERARSARAAGLHLVLATGRGLAALDMDRLTDCFDAFVLEGGAMWGRPGDWRVASAPDALWDAAERLVSEGHDIRHGLASFSAEGDLWHHPVLAGSGLDVRRNRERLDVTPPGINKWTGLEGALQDLGLASARVVAIGDSENDLPLFENAGFAIAVGDSEPAVAAAADSVAPHAANEGFAWALDQVAGQVVGDA